MYDGLKAMLEAENDLEDEIRAENSKSNLLKKSMVTFLYLIFILLFTASIYLQRKHSWDWAILLVGVPLFAHFLSFNAMLLGSKYLEKSRSEAFNNSAFYKILFILSICAYAI